MGAAVVITVHLSLGFHQLIIN